MKGKYTAAILMSIAFGFLLFGSGSNFAGSVGIHSSNKVFTPSIFNGFGAGSISFSASPIFRPSFGSDTFGNFNARGGFMWNFFDP